MLHLYQQIIVSKQALDEYEAAKKARSPRKDPNRFKAKDTCETTIFAAENEEGDIL